jgi:bifunctional N-acetylglucosamine-1-phosphate-uridyltransferase/glucosamine-1-phosphate-acetyltransferase GlmU-like protein
VGARAEIRNTTAQRTEIGDDARVGPFCSLGPGSVVEPRGMVPPFATLP